MGMEKSHLERVDVATIRDNALLSLSIQGNDVSRCVETIKEYGLLTPVVITPSKDGGHTVVFGSCELAALRGLGIQTTEAIAVNCQDDTELHKLALLLTSLKPSLNPLSEGLILREFLKGGKVSQADAALALGKSVSWVSNRLNTVENLEESVLQMAMRGELCARTAQEIAKLAPEVQYKFAVRVIKEGLPKSVVERLVALYNSADVNDAVRSHILEDPKDAISRIKPELKRLRKKPSKVKENDSESKFHSGMRLLLELVTEVEELLAGLEPKAVRRARSTLTKADEHLKRFLGVISAKQIQAEGEEFAPGQIEVKKPRRTGGGEVDLRHGSISADQTALCG